MFARFKNVSLIKKVVFAVAIPITSYLIMAGPISVESYHVMKESAHLLEHSMIYAITGDLSKSLQIERELTVSAMINTNVDFF